MSLFLLLRSVVNGLKFFFLSSMPIHQYYLYKVLRNSIAFYIMKNTGGIFVPSNLIAFPYRSLKYTTTIKSYAFSLVLFFIVKGTQSTYAFYLPWLCLTFEIAKVIFFITVFLFHGHTSSYKYGYNLNVKFQSVIYFTFFSKAPFNEIEKFYTFV